MSTETWRLSQRLVPLCGIEGPLRLSVNPGPFGVASQTALYAGWLCRESPPPLRAVYFTRESKSTEIKPQRSPAQKECSQSGSDRDQQLNQMPVLFQERPGGDLTVCSAFSTPPKRLRQHMLPFSSSSLPAPVGFQSATERWKDTKMKSWEGTAGGRGCRPALGGRHRRGWGATAGGPLSAQLSTASESAEARVSSSCFSTLHSPTCREKPPTGRRPASVKPHANTVTEQTTQLKWVFKQHPGIQICQDYRQWGTGLRQHVTILW